MRAQATLDHEEIDAAPFAGGSIGSCDHSVDHAEPAGLLKHVRRHIEVAPADPRSAEVRNDEGQLLKQIHVASRHALAIVEVHTQQVDPPRAYAAPVPHLHAVGDSGAAREVQVKRQPGMPGDHHAHPGRVPAGGRDHRRLQ